MLFLTVVLFLIHLANSQPDSKFMTFYIVDLAIKDPEIPRHWDCTGYGEVKSFLKHIYYYKSKIMKICFFKGDFGWGCC